MKRFLISRTDSIGDVMLTLPMCVWLKERFPSSELVFIGKGYTRPVVDSFSVIDRFIDWADYSGKTAKEKAKMLGELDADVILHVFPVKEIAVAAKSAGIPLRIGTSHRLFHWFTCNNRVSFSRKNADLHEAQLNFQLLRPFGLTEPPSLSSLIENLEAFRVPEVSLPPDVEDRLSRSEKTVILHPKSQGSAVEWPMDSYINLAGKLSERGYTVFFTGTEKEGVMFRSQLPADSSIIDVTGKMDLYQLIRFISRCGNLVACSTGPLHIAAYCGIRTVGLYSPKRPIHPGRWAAIGKDVRILTFDDHCPACTAGKPCDCIRCISVDKVLQEIV
ncbi:MAG: hypothetical protein RL213_1137 [Bacteroidota bacterium]|jgi:ADP-heptose:LPS heptosyltransferase